MSKINYNKAFTALFNEDKLPRKAKKQLLGKKISNKALKKLLDSVVITDVENSYGETDIKPYTFCPTCGCKLMRGSGNLTEYPEHWEKFRCLKCNEVVGMIDNSPFTHALEWKENDYQIDI